MIVQGPTIKFTDELNKNLHPNEKLSVIYFCKVLLFMEQIYGTQKIKAQHVIINFIIDSNKANF